MKVIAVGNTLMKDDAVAVRAAEYLKDKLERAGCEVIIGETDYEYSLSRMEDGCFIVIIDALWPDGDPGGIHVFNLDEVLDSREVSMMQHDVSILDRLRLMRYTGKSFKGYFIGIEAAKIDCGCGLSEILSDKFFCICSEVERIINNILNGELYYA
jgi:hydrogenase maturation protease